MENNGKPEVRFQGFHGNWEQCTLGEVGGVIRESVNPQSEPDRKFIEYSMPSYDNNRSPEEVLGKSMQSTRLKISGDILLINKLNVRQKRIWLVNDAPDNAVASSEFMPYASTDIDLVFLEQLMLSDKSTKTLESISSGTSNSQKRITPSDFLKNQILIPSNRSEQIRIGMFFNQIDDTIILHQKELYLLKQTKKSFMKKMFPKEGEKVPEVRFSGFTYNWKQYKLGELINVSSASRVHKHEWTDSGVRFFRSSDVMSTHNGNTNQKAFISKELYERLAKKSGKVAIDDVLVTGGGTVGMPYLITDSEPLYFKDADLIWLKNSGIFGTDTIIRYN